MFDRRRADTGSVPSVSRVASTKVPALLTEPGFCGTLAAARELGKRGIPVWTAAPVGHVPAAHSRYVAKHWRCPSASDVAQQIDWLVAFGESHPGTVLYPTSDDFAWLQSANASVLRRHFRMYSPALDAIEQVLDKRRLSEACAAVGIESPRSYFVESRAELEAVAQRVPFPVLIKQRTQVLSNTRSKGTLVRRPEKLLETYEWFLANNQHAPAVRSRMSSASRPLIQEFYPDAHKGTYLVSGFVDRHHAQIVAQASVKVLQYPRTLGIALCMEEAPLDPELTARILELCKHTGYFGVFQIEFLVDGERKLLNDFNPRYYHYMAFDVSRGLPLPWLAHLGACGDERALASELAKAGRGVSASPSVFSYRLQLSALLRAQRIAGTMSGEDFRHWRRWYKRHQRHAVDAVAEPGDPWPEIVAGASMWLSNLRHPRAFARSIALDR